MSRGSASSKPLGDLESNHAFSPVTPNSVYTKVKHAAGCAAAAAPPTTQAEHIVLDGQVVRRVFGALTNVYQAAVLVQHWYCDETYQVAQQVRATCRDALSSMVQCVTRHLEADVAAAWHQKNTQDAHNAHVEVWTGDVIEVLGGIAEVADSVRLISRDTLNHQGSHDLQSLAHTMCTIGHWLVLLLAPPQATSHAHPVLGMPAMYGTGAAAAHAQDAAASTIAAPLAPSSCNTSPPKHRQTRQDCTHTTHVSGGHSGGLSILTKHQSVRVVSCFAHVACLPPPYVAVLLSLPLLPTSEEANEVTSYRREVLDFVAALDARHVHKLLTAVPQVIGWSLFPLMSRSPVTCRSLFSLFLFGSASA